MNLDVLISYAYAAKLLPRIAAAKAQYPRLRVVLDSGAFTAWKQGQSVDLQAYIAFVEDNQHLFHQYFSLDVIEDPEATRRNLATMRARGLDPIPVITRGVTVAQASEAAAATGYVGIGGLVRTPGQAKFLRALSPALVGKKTHLLGVNTIGLLKTFGVASADSSSWNRPVRFGTVFPILRGAPYRLDRTDFLKKTPQAVWLCDRVGLSIQALQKPWHGRDGAVVRKLAGRVAIMNAETIYTLTGARVFSACTSKENVADILAGWDHFNSKEST